MDELDEIHIKIITDLNIDSPFEIDERINEAIENEVGDFDNQDDRIEFFEDARIRIKKHFYDIDNWDTQALFFLFDMNPDDDYEVINQELFISKVSPYLAQYEGSAETGLSLFLLQAVNRLSLERFNSTWEELIKKDNDDDKNVSVKSTGIRIYSMNRNVLNDNIYDFIFQLNEPIHDVLSFSLVECNIPLSWFTFSEQYKNNYFLVKISQNTDSINMNIIDENIKNSILEVNDDCTVRTEDNNDNQDNSKRIIDKRDYSSYKTITISDGNYNAEDLAKELNSKIYQAYIDDDDIDLGDESSFKVFEYEHRTRRFIAIVKQDIRFHFVFYTGFQAEAGENTQVNDCLGFAMGFLAPQNNIKYDSYDLDLQGDDGTFIRAPFIANTYGTPIINIIIDDFTNNQIGRSIIDGKPSEYDFDPVPEDRIDYINNEEVSLNERYSQKEAEARALHKSQLDVLSRKSFPSNVSYSNIFASIPVTRSPCNTDVLNDSTPTTIYYSSNDLFSFKRYFSGKTNISKLRVRLTNSLGKPLYLEQDYFIILKVNHVVRMPNLLF